MNFGKLQLTKQQLQEPLAALVVVSTGVAGFAGMLIAAILACLLIQLLGLDINSNLAQLVFAVVTLGTMYKLMNQELNDAISDYVNKIFNGNKQTSLVNRLVELLPTFTDLYTSAPQPLPFTPPRHTS